MMSVPSEHLVDLFKRESPCFWITEIDQGNERGIQYGPCGAISSRVDVDSLLMADGASGRGSLQIAQYFQEILDSAMGVIVTTMPLTAAVSRGDLYKSIQTYKASLTQKPAPNLVLSCEDC